MTKIKLKVGFGDIAYIIGIALPALREQWPLVKQRLKEIAETDATVQPFYYTLDEIYTRITT